MPGDDAEGLVVLARAMVRGQGKTEGLFERRVRISRQQKVGLRMGPTDPEAEMARTREKLAGEMADALRFALFALFQNDPGEVNRRHDPTARKAKPFLDAFERAIDQTFFDALFDEAEAEPGEARHAVRSAWVRACSTLPATSSRPPISRQPAPRTAAFARGCGPRMPCSTQPGANPR